MVTITELGDTGLWVVWRDDGRIWGACYASLDRAIESVIRYGWGH